MRSKTFKVVAGLALALASHAVTAEVKVGYIGSFTGPTAMLGQEQYDGFMLGIEMANSRQGGVPVKVIREDDQFRPEIGMQATRRLLEQEKVNAIVAPGSTQLFMASLPRLSDSGKVVFSTLSGPAVLAGERCKPNVFVTAYPSDGPAEAMGEYVKQQGFKNVFLMTSNYQGGKDMLVGFKRHYTGNIAEEIYTQLGQTDYSAEITQIQLAKPDAVFVFYPGGMGINFTKQAAQAGLLPDLPVFSVFTVDPTTLPAIGDSANGITTSVVWDAELDNPASKAFVKAFTEKHGRAPSHWAAVSFDTARILTTALRNIEGDVSNDAKLVEAVKKAGTEFESVRGSFSFNRNNMPIQDYYIYQYTQENGQIVAKPKGTALTGHQDAYVSQCKMS